ncbi:hypothetical protein SAMN05216357_13513 [Porphyromonadaceae bacterium KH3CP3RA]|nr:hypothetical protein SAMN05216357_13513 [Porphyromonadaceae bacterium KH3CP3RA]
MCEIDLSNITAIGSLVTAIAALIAIGVSIWTFRKNNSFIRKQQFETTFFNMMKQLEDIVSKLYTTPHL